MKAPLLALPQEIHEHSVNIAGKAKALTQTWSLLRKKVKVPEPTS